MDNLLQTSYGLEKYILEAIVKEIESIKNIDEALLFGSRAKGTYNPGSDIDIALKGSLRLNDILNLSLALENLNLPYKFDLLDYKKIKEPALMDHIHRVGIVLFRR